MSIAHTKQEMLSALYAPYREKAACPFPFEELHTTVLGEGSLDARLMIIGEAPGRDEDLQGRPFVGRSGRLLSKVLEALGTQRSEVFITNVVKWRPPNNRQPTIAEMDVAKKMLLMHEIEIIKPKVICTLGSSALHALLGPDTKISQARGKIIQKDGLTIAPTYHPAYILRNNAELEKFMGDIEQAIALSIAK